MKLKDKLMKKVGKKDDLDPLDKEAKMGVMKELSRQAGAMLGDKIQPKMKAEVAADSKEGMKEGLDKAAGLVDKAPDVEHDPDKIMEGAEEDMGADLDHDSEMGEDPAHKAKVLAGDASPEEIDEMIAHLQALKDKKQAPMA